MPPLFNEGGDGAGTADSDALTTVGCWRRERLSREDRPTADGFSVLCDTYKLTKRACAGGGGDTREVVGEWIEGWCQRAVPDHDALQLMISSGFQHAAGFFSWDEGCRHIEAAAAAQPASSGGTAGGVKPGSKVIAAPLRASSRNVLPDVRLRAYFDRDVVYVGFL